MATEACRDWRGDLAIDALGRLEEPDARRAARAPRRLRRLPRRARRALGGRRRARPRRPEPRRRRRRFPDPRRSWANASSAGCSGNASRTAGAGRRGVLATVGRCRGRGRRRARARARERRRSRAARSSRCVRPTARCTPRPCSTPDTGTRVQLHVDGLDDREWYWLWVTGSDGKRVAAGTFSASSASENVTMTRGALAGRARGGSG